MGLASHIVKRAGSANYYLRLSVPLTLQPILGRKEIWQSLGTANPAEAKRRARPILAKRQTEFDALSLTRPLNDHELQAAIWERYTALIQQDDAQRQALPTDDDLAEVWQALVSEFGEYSTAAWRIFEDIATKHDTDKANRAKRLSALKAEIAKGETKTVAPVMSEIITTRRLAVLERSPEARKLAQGLQRAEIQALKLMTERDEGEFGGTPTDPVVQPPKATAPHIAAPGESVLELLEVYLTENPNGVGAPTLRQTRAVVEVFAEFVGAHMPASAITKKHVRDWKTALASYPIKATAMKVFSGKSFADIVKLNAKLALPVITAKTRNRYLAGLGAFSKWLVGHGHLEHLPTSGMFVKVNKSEAKIQPYTAEQLQTIFSSPLFTGFERDGREHKPGNVETRDHRFWLPLISLYSGARQGEIGQLLTTNVKQVSGEWVFQITPEGDEAKHLKNKASQRLVPVHPMLVRLGLLDHHKAMMERGEQWLFPSIETDKDGSRTAEYSRFYAKYLKAIGVKVDRSVNFHSFRHGFADALREAGHLDSEFGFLLGHTQNNVTGRYGSAAEGHLKRRVDLVKSVQYEGLDLPGLAKETKHSEM